MKTRNSLLRGMRSFYVVLLAFLLVGVVFGCGGGGGGSSSGGDGGTPPPPANVPPVANAGSDQQANEGSAVTLDGTGSSDSDGTVTGFSWTQTAGPTVTLTGANPATPSFTAPAVTAQTVLTFALTVTDNDGALSTNAANVNVTVNLAGFLSLTTSLPPARVDLTIEGTLDWVHWGRTGIVVDRKNQDPTLEKISTYTEIGNPGGPQQLPNTPVFYSWSDGTPDGDETDTRTGIFFASSGDPIQVGEGFFLTVKADTTPKTLKLYLGGEDAQGTLTVALDGVPSPAPISLVRQGGEFTQVATITFKALSAGDLTVTYVLADEFNTGVDTTLTLQAATLSLAVPAISPPGGVFTGSVDVSLSSAIPGAAIRYTVEGSDPTEQSPLFTGPFSLASSQTVKARVFVGGIGGDVASAEFTVNPSISGGSLSAFVDAPAATVDLTTEGSLDWAHWGRANASSYDRKNVPQQIGTVAPGYVPVNSPGNPQQQTDAPVAYSWSDGTPTVSATDTTTGIFFSSSTGLAVNDGYSLTVPADATQKTLKIYLGGFSAEGTLTAQLSDGSAANATLPISNELSVFTKVVTITFSAGSGSGNLTVSYRLTNDFGNPSNLTLQAATLD